MSITGKQFEFNTQFLSSPKKYGEIDLYQCGEVCCNNGYEIYPHTQWCHEISYIVSGQGWFYTNDVPTLVQGGDIYISQIGTSHAIRTDDNSSLRYAYIGFSFNEDLDVNVYGDLKKFYENVTIPISKDKEDISIPFYRCIDEFYRDSPMNRTMVENYLKQIMILAYRSFQPTRTGVYLQDRTKPEWDNIYPIVRYIDNNIFEIKSVRELAEAIGYNYSYLSALFRRKVGITISDYINIKKIQKGTELFKYGNMSITQVALKLNFSCVQSFNKVFKRIVGYSPTQYLQNIKNGMEEFTEEKYISNATNASKQAESEGMRA